MSAEVLDRNDLNEAISPLMDEIRQLRLEVASMPSPVMTLTELATYWKVNKQSLLNWTKRKVHALPVSYVGADPRFHLSEVNDWAKQEANRKLGATDLGVQG